MNVIPLYVYLCSRSFRRLPIRLPEDAQVKTDFIELQARLEVLKQQPLNSDEKKVIVCTDFDRKRKCRMSLGAHLKCYTLSERCLECSM